MLLLCIAFPKQLSWLGPLFSHGVSCGLQMLGPFLLANFVVAGLGCVHVWFGVCFGLQAGLCFANVLVGCLVGILVWVLVVRVAV